MFLAPLGDTARGIPIESALQPFPALMAGDARAFKGGPTRFPQPAKETEQSSSSETRESSRPPGDGSSQAHGITAYIALLIAMVSIGGVIWFARKARQVERKIVEAETKMRQAHKDLLEGQSKHSDDEEKLLGAVNRISRVETELQDLSEKVALLESRPAHIQEIGQDTDAPYKALDRFRRVMDAIGHVKAPELDIGTRRLKLKKLSELRDPLGIITLMEVVRDRTYAASLREEAARGLRKYAEVGEFKEYWNGMEECLKKVSRQKTLPESVKKAVKESLEKFPKNG